MKMPASIFFFLLLGCGSTVGNRAEVIQRNDAHLFSYQDVSGRYELAREVKLEKNRLANRVQMFTSAGGNKRLIEKTLALSSVGSVKSRQGRMLAIRPELSQHTVWLEGKKYFTQLKLDPKSRVLKASLESPEAKWQGTREVKVPKGRVFCFYSQLPECLVMAGYLEAKDRRQPAKSFYLVWDSWPYHQEHFTGLKESPFAAAKVTFESMREDVRSYTVEVQGQVLSLHFDDSSMSFLRMFWSTQGISLLPPAESVQEEL